MNRKPIPQNIKQFILLNRQGNKCANIPGGSAPGVGDYQCLLWKYQDGTFDESGYEFDHIDEYCLTQDNHHKNIQAMCPNCHSYKTKRFNKNKRKFSSIELDQGRSMMYVDTLPTPPEKNPRKKRKKRKISKKINKEIIVID